MNPKGKLIIIGGKEDKGESDFPDIKKEEGDFRQLQILEAILPPKKSMKLEIITTASRKPEEIKETYSKAFRQLHHSNVGFLHITEKAGTKDQKILDRISNAKSVLISGGNQFRLSTILGGTPVEECLKQRYNNDPDFTLAGTSAGAMVMSQLMIISGGMNEAMLRGDLKLTAGFAMLNHSVIDTHFIKRGRFGRLAHAVVMNPGCIGIGLGEDTALIIKKGHVAECHGSGMVVIIDASQLKETDITEVDERTSFYIDNLIVHLMVDGCGYNFQTRECFHENRKTRKRA
jgi:cyanophycinase